MDVRTPGTGEVVSSTLIAGSNIKGEVCITTKSTMSTEVFVVLSNATTYLKVKKELSI